MIIRIDQMSPDPVYQQIRDGIVEAIARGELLPADWLPSVRALASDLGVNLHTVNKAYAVLRDEGYLIMRGRAGATVADFQCVATPERIAENAAKLDADLRQLALEHRAQGGTEQGFLDAARAQARTVFAESNLAEKGRDMHVLGIDENGGRLKKDASAGQDDARSVLAKEVQ